MEKTSRHVEELNESLNNMQERMVFWFLCDNWSHEQAMMLLVGLDPQETTIDDDASDYVESDNPQLDVAVTLDGIETLPYSYLLEDMDLKNEDLNKLRQFQLELNYLTDLFGSGDHPVKNPPQYYIEWAESKNHIIPWLGHVIKVGLYIPEGGRVEKPTAEKGLLTRERETMVRIIHALAKNGYRYPNHGTIKEIVSDFRMVGNGVSEKTLMKYLKEFDWL